MFGSRVINQKLKVCGGFVNIRAGGVGGDGAVGGGGGELAYLFGAAVSRGEYAGAGSFATLVSDYVAFGVEGDEVFERLVLGDLADADEGALAIHDVGLARGGVLKAEML